MSDVVVVPLRFFLLVVGEWVRGEGGYVRRRGGRRARMFPLWKLSAANDGFVRENLVMGTGGRRRRRFQ